VLVIITKIIRGQDALSGLNLNKGEKGKKGDPSLFEVAS
jgi:hypothetical protein